MDGDILKQRYYAYYEKGSPDVRIVLRLDYDSQDEKSEYVKSLEDNETPLENLAFDQYTHNYLLNFTYLLGDLIATDNPFERLKTLFIGASEKASLVFAHQLHKAEKLYKQYVSYNNFSLEFLSVFANEKRIHINPTLCEIINDRFFPLKTDSVTDKIFYEYESTDIKDIIFSTIHFALSDGYKLVKCKHCERWFFTQTLKEEYCKRLSPCFDLVICNTKVLREKVSCGKAVDTIKRRFRDRKKTIYDKWRNCSDNCPLFDDCSKCPYEDCVFEQKCDELCKAHKQNMSNILKKPTVENIVEYHKYLYSDEMPKQERPNRRKSNAEKRRLMGL